MQLKLSPGTFTTNGALDVQKMVAYGKAFPDAGRIALNRMIDRSKAHIPVILNERYNIRRAAVARATTVGKRASARDLVAKLTVKERRKIPLAEFGARRVDSQTVVVKVLRGAPKVVGGGFMQKPRKGKYAGRFVIYKRTGVTLRGALSKGSRLLQELKRGLVKRSYGPGIPAMFASTDAQRKLIQFAEERFPKVFADAINFKKK